jgi:hypothetical protein
LVLAGYLKKTISILLTILFLYSTVGFLAVHFFLSNYYKELGLREVKEIADADAIQILVFDKSDIQNSKIEFMWIHSDEFRYNGDMYDIVKKEENENQLILYCLNDSRETKLEKDFERELDTNTTNKKQNAGDNNPFNTLNSEAAGESSLNQSDVKRISFGFNYIKNYAPICTEIPSPPPKFS